MLKIVSYYSILSFTSDHPIIPQHYAYYKYTIGDISTKIYMYLKKTLKIKTRVKSYIMVYTTAVILIKNKE